MKDFLSIFVMFIFTMLCNFNADAKIYYVAASGNDSNSGTSTSAPWKTLSKVSSYTGFVSGDQILFNRGDVFYGMLVVRNSGSAGNPITYGAYGSGANPVITGFTSITSWTNKGNNIWESTNAVSSLSSCNMVSINGVNTAMGRTPNYPNYYTWNSHSGNSSISTGLSGSPNWTGAELAVFTTSYIVARHPITSQSGGTIYFSSTGDLWQNAPGYFLQQFQIQNDIRTLDTLNEWYYNPSTKRLDIYNTSTPTGVQMATVDTLIWTNNQSYITITGLTIMGCNKDAISIATSNNINVNNCMIRYIGGTAVYGITSKSEPGIKIEQNNISDVNNCGIDLKNWYTGDTIRSNTLTNINMLIGMQDYSHTINGGVVGILALSDNSAVSYNNLNNIGTNGIWFRGNNISVDHNLINHAGYGNGVKDVAGIYGWNGLYNTYSGVKILNNIVLNTESWSMGIFCDEGSNGIEVGYNTVYDALRGIYVDDGYNLNIHDNTTFNTNRLGIGAGLFLNNNPGSPKLRYITLKNNKFIAKTIGDRSLWVITTDSASMPRPFTSDYNYFAKPLGDNSNNIQTDMVGVSYVQRSLTSWQSLNGQDAHSKQSPKAITDTLDFNFQYNATNSPVTVSLPYNYMDITGTTYNGSITLQPYTSAVLIKNGTISGNLPPKANAGSDQAVTLPTNTVTLAGTGADSDGSISAYLWSQISGPSTSTIISPTAATTIVNSLVQGIYQFQLQVTDNLGATGKDTIQVTVNAASSLLPAVTVSNPVNGLVFKSYSGAYSTLPNFSSLTPTLTGTTPNFNITVANASVNFALNFTGYINVPSDGQYTFYTNSDDGSNLYIDNVLVVNNNGVHAALEKSGTIGLKAGMHAISISYFQAAGGQSLIISYSSTSITKQTIPSSVLYYASTPSLLPASNVSNLVGGLNYSKYNGSYSVLPNFSNLSPVSTGVVSSFDISVANASANYAVNFTGYINIPSDGQYTFYTNSDDGSSLYIDNILVVNNDGIHAPSESSGTIGLKAGMHLISVGFFQAGGGQSLIVSYSSSAITKRAIPSSSLYHASSDGLLAATNVSNPVNSLNYNYYPGSFSVIPSFSSLTPTSTGRVANFDITLLSTSTYYFAVNFAGYINVPSDGQYTFYTNSDDGSYLYIDNILVVNNDGIHAPLESSGTIGLKAGMHPISVGYFQFAGGKSLMVSYSGPGITKQQVPPSVLYISGSAGSTSLAGNSFVISSVLPIEVKVYPNPFENNLQVALISDNAGPFKLILLDELGRIIWEKSGTKPVGTLMESINTSALQKGIYFLKLVQNSKAVYSLKLEK